MIRVEMLSTGDEVLHGQIVDTNAAWLADTLFQQGLPMTSRTTVGDSLASLIATLQARSHEADVLIVNGGLGPTSDDLSALAAARACGVELAMQQEWLEQMEAWFASRGRIMAASNRKQAEIPANAELIDNPVGTACGFALQLNRCWMFFTPGVPSEFKVMVEQQIIPRLKAKFSPPEPPVCLRLTTFGRGESDIAAELEPLALPEGVVMGYRSSMPIIEIKLTGPTSQRVAMEQVWQQVRLLLAECTIFEGTEGLPALLARELEQRGEQLAVSEQYTAGLLYWQLATASVPLRGADILPPQQETLEQQVTRTRDFAAQQQANLALSVGSLEQEEISIALHTPEGSFGQRVKFSTGRHNLETRQKVVAMMGMNMLRRWLHGSEVSTGHGWIDVVETVRQ
ncbi:nicotinamide mononucleotide deamidase-related protein YfaY [Pantoea sp. Bo_2]|uniref:nicotinamide mononucleotide deamidase-related protein YfaY n=1 Tax=unclassified Pantoea TaxID=2630326 RepID=UPI001232AA73|nr:MULTISPECIES: nicotinamide mononucleotide deamidase-related protein YfaY [unclassified Pantoea]KAA5949828.1 nicotinamide mononucleotide deamidase-related protein YfaY [Pantoea sp. VH_3]KAA5954001.1 nicotinamide mononucleotide deamidase-related protein YfaY [Pantoea sp. VH_25]KAA5960918.1 nicotinamide mononucleotide deamidase-related protein YfaY [Pantoea sp. VH_24]KAA5964542.1 nicotinamide mononucleotide deamidase-related protein YfaY [Pantoea sp. VH_16]KAA5968521.1 nicotinamide mononucleot